MTNLQMLILMFQEVLLTTKRELHHFMVKNGTEEEHRMGKYLTHVY